MRAYIAGHFDFPGILKSLERMLLQERMGEASPCQQIKPELRLLLLFLHLKCRHKSTYHLYHNFMKIIPNGFNVMNDIWLHFLLCHALQSNVVTVRDTQHASPSKHKAFEGKDQYLLVSPAHTQ